MLPLTTLYDEYVDRPNLSEQKNPFEYIIPPPSRGVGKTIWAKNIADDVTCQSMKLKLFTKNFTKKDLIKFSKRL